MGNIESFVKVCGSALKRQKGDMTLEVESNNFIERNKDNYFQKEDYSVILERFPDYRDWMDQNSTPSSKEKPGHKKIRWKEGETIGHGSFGKVVMGLNLETGCMMAAKQVHIGAVNTAAQQDRIKALEMEIELLSQFSHKNIVSYYGSDRTKDTFIIFLEYISGGTIASLLDKYGPFNENLIRVYTRQILQGLEYLHVRNTIHRDIKGANVLVDNSGVCKLTDFGTAKRISSIVESDPKYLPSIRGTVNWMAPEVIKQTTLGRYCDIWSVGCTVIEMATGKAPWASLLNPDASCVSLLYQIAQAKSPPPFPKSLSSEALDFLKQCFKINPQERPNVIKLLNHKFISGVEILYKQLSTMADDKQNMSIDPVFHQVTTISSPNDHKITKRNYQSLWKDKSAIPEQNNSKADEQFTVDVKTNDKDRRRSEDTRNGIPPIPRRLKGATMYDFGITFPLSEKTAIELKREENMQTSEDRAQSKSKSRKSSESKDGSSNDESSKFGLATLRGLPSSDRSELESLGTVRTLTDGLKTISSSHEDDRDGESSVKSRFDPRRLHETKARMRPLGKNKRFLLKKPGYANLSEDESIAGSSFLALGSPGNAHETSEDRGPHLSSGKGGNNSSIFTLNGSAFPWPEGLSQIDENENTNDVKQWDLHYNEKIEEEEEEKDDVESEKGQEKIVIESDREDQTEMGKEGYRTSHNLETKHGSNDSIHSNHELYGFDQLDETQKDPRDKENFRKESRTSFDSQSLTKLTPKPSLPKIKVKETVKNQEDSLHVSQKLVSAAGKFKDFGEDLIIDNLTVTKNNSTPGIRSDSSKWKIEQNIEKYLTNGNNGQAYKQTFYENGIRGEVSTESTVPHSNEQKNINIFDNFTKIEFECK